MNTKETTVEDVLKKAYEDACNIPCMLDPDDPRRKNVDLKKAFAPTVIEFCTDAPKYSNWTVVLMDPRNMTFDAFKEWCRERIESILSELATTYGYSGAKCIHVHDLNIGDKEPVNGGKGVDISGELLDDHQKEGLRWLVEDFEYMAKKHE